MLDWYKNLSIFYSFTYQFCRKLASILAHSVKQPFLQASIFTPESYENKAKENTLKAASIDNTISIPNRGLADTAAVNFVTELLTMTLAGQNDEVTIEPQDFLYDPGTGIDATESIRAEIDCEDVVETEGKIEITLSGAVENDQGRNETFTLYFFMWWDRYATISIKNGYGKTLGTNSLLIQFEHTSEQLPDTVFELDMYRKDPAGHQHSLGQGRGYLVFGRRV